MIDRHDPGVCAVQPIDTAVADIEDESKVTTARQASDCCRGPSILDTSSTDLILRIAHVLAQHLRAIRGAATLLHFVQRGARCPGPPSSPTHPPRYGPSEPHRSPPQPPP